ncbi:MAG: DciA family protein [Terriglobales bacterium]
MEPLRDILALVPAEAAELPPALPPALAWQLAAGPELGGRSRCLGLSGGRLRVQADDAATASQARSVEPELRRELNRMLGAGAVASLEICL